MAAKQSQSKCPSGQSPDAQQNRKINHQDTEVHEAAELRQTNTEPSPTKKAPPSVDLRALRVFVFDLTKPA